MTEMTIDDFIEREIDRLQRFKVWREDMQRRDPEYFPVYMDGDNWLEQYDIFSET
jgi:hypothetical protein